MSIVGVNGQFSRVPGHFGLTEHHYRDVYRPRNRGLPSLPCDRIRETIHDHPFSFDDQRYYAEATILILVTL